MSAAATPTTVRVMVVDDFQVVRDGVRSVLDREPDLEVVAEAGNAGEAVRLAAGCQPDVVVMDVRLGDDSGIEATREIRSRHPGTRVLMLTAFADDHALYSSVIAGASGFVLKQIRLKELVDAIRAVAAGETLISPADSKDLLARLEQGKTQYDDPRLASLTAQEDRVLHLIVDGLTNREIATRLELAEKTVKNYLSNILGKLEVQRRAQAAVYLERHTGSQG